jgi:calcineurin-like phosphoesterase family protein
MIAAIGQRSSDPHAQGQTMSVYFTSDHHFGHAGARSFYRRPFASVAEMDRQMVARWNSVVKPQDEVWHLGDFAVRQSRDRIDSLLHELHGQKHLIAGNNDDAAVTASPGWKTVQPYAEVMFDGMMLILCHYPFRTWRDMGKGSINLHGHSHGKLKPQPRQVDAGVDVWNFRPVQLTELVEKTGARRAERASTASAG